MTERDSLINKSDDRKEKVDLKELLKSRLSIEEVLEYYGNIRSVKGNWECTRHSSKGGCSLKIYEMDNACECVSPNCDLKGDIFSVIGIYENLDTKSEFPLILKKACELARLDYEKYQTGDPVKIKEAKERKEIILKSHELFYKFAKTEIANIFSYVESKRKLLPEDKELLNLGYLPPEKWGEIKNKMLTTIPEIKNIFFSDKDGKKHYLIDTYFALSGRIIHPHFFKGDLLYFTGELTKNARYNPNTKYVKINANFSATGNAEGYLLDSLNQSHETIIFAEGFWDGVKLQLLNIPVVSFGTCKVSKYFIDNYYYKLKPFKKVIVCFDTDREDNQSGLKGAIALCEELLKKGITQLYISELPLKDGEKMDIDDYLSVIPNIEDKKIAVKTQIVDKGINFWEYLIKELKKIKDDKSQFEMAKEIIETSKLYNPITKNKIQRQIKTILKINDGDFNKIFGISSKKIIKEPKIETHEKEINQDKKKTPVLKIGYFDEKLDYLKIAEDYIKIYPLIYTQSCIWWKWDDIEKHWVFVDDIDILLSIKTISNWGGVINQSVRGQLLNALMICGREKNNNLKEPNKYWVQFKDKIVNIMTGEIIEPNPEYFIVNRLPWKLGDSEETPHIDKLFSEWCKTPYLLHELLSYCCLSSNPIHRLFCLFGKGRNGKTTYQELINKFVGVENMVATDIDRLKSNPRFEISRLYKKLFCFLGETTHDTIDRMDIIKRIIGNDSVPIEWKGKNTGKNVNLYCKMIMGTNSIPMIADKTLGCNSKWIIIKFESVFRESRDVLKEIPDAEFENLSRKMVNILKKLIERGKFKDEKSFEEKAIELEELSNPIIGFIKKYCDKDPNLDLPKYLFENKLNKYCKFVGLRSLNYREINTAMKDEGWEDCKKRTIYSDSTNPIQHWLGISINEEKYNEILRSLSSAVPYISTPLSSEIETSGKDVVHGTCGTEKNSKGNTLNCSKNKVSLDNSKQLLLIKKIIVDLYAERNNTFENIRSKWHELEKNYILSDFDIFVEKLKIEGIIYEPTPGFLGLI